MVEYEQPVSVKPSFNKEGKRQKKKKKKKTYKREMSSQVEEGEKQVRRQREYETTGEDRESIKRMCERESGN
jgi:hypothetical protein